MSVDGERIPAIGSETGALVILYRQVGWAIDADAVVVEQYD